jgi:hypothetical protein
MHWDFRGFGFTLQELAQRSTLRSFLWIIFCANSGFFEHVHRVVSSANIRVLVLDVSETGKSLQYTRYRMGDGTAWIWMGLTFGGLLVRFRFDFPGRI